MVKVTLDMGTFKALASDTRLDILKALDGKKLSLKDISRHTKLNKATLHEHLVKLNEAGLVKKKERDGHKWVYYKLTWKGECLLHPENTKIVVLFSTTFFTLAVGIISLLNFIKGKIVATAHNFPGYDRTIINAKTHEFADVYAAPAEKGSEAVSFGASNVAEVPLINQTSTQLSHSVLSKVDVRGAVQNVIKPENIEWQADTSSRVLYLCGNESKAFVSEVPPDIVLNVDNDAMDGVVSNGNKIGTGATEWFTESCETVPEKMVGVVHDPALYWIAIACIIACGILLSFVIWRYYKNKKIRI